MYRLWPVAIIFWIPRRSLKVAITEARVDQLPRPAIGIAMARFPGHVHAKQTARNAATVVTKHVDHV